MDCIKDVRMIISDNVKVRAWLHPQILAVTYVHHTPEDCSFASDWFITLFHIFREFKINTDDRQYIKTTHVQMLMCTHSHTMTRPFFHLRVLTVGFNPQRN